MEEYKPNKIIICGHSLGAAVSALVYILLSESEEMKEKYELYNMTFALPLFGNLTLRDYLEQNNSVGNLTSNMYHFVIAEDIVPALLYINKSYGETTFTAKILWKFFINKIISSCLQEETEKEMAKKFVKEVDKVRKKDDPLFLFEEQDGYVAMGNYLLLQDEKIYELPNDPQWVGQALVESLKILGQLNSPNSTAVGKILENHALVTYESRIMKNLFE